MATRAVLSPITNFSALASTSCFSSDKISCGVTSQASLKCLQRFSSRLGHGSDNVFSSGKLLVKQNAVRSNSVFARVEYCTDSEPQSMTDESALVHVTGIRDWFTSCRELPTESSSRNGRARTVRSVFRCNCTSHESQETVDREDFSKTFLLCIPDDIEMHRQPVEFGSDSIEDADEPSGGVAIAVKILQFYKREISPLLPGSCRFVPTCSEYGMQAFKKYGVVKGTILTAWRLSRCNPLGGSGFDPPRWFDEPKPPPY